jgi:hypothetical protein
MERRENHPDVDMADGTEDPPLASWIAEAALDRWDLLDQARRKRVRREREPRN